MRELVGQGSEYTDQEILTSLKQDIADIDSRIDMLWGVLSDQHEINTLQFRTNKTLEHNILVIAPRDEVAH